MDTRVLQTLHELGIEPKNDDVFTFLSNACYVSGAAGDKFPGSMVVSVTRDVLDSFKGFETPAYTCDKVEIAPWFLPRTINVPSALRTHNRKMVNAPKMVVISFGDENGLIIHDKVDTQYVLGFGGDNGFEITN